MYPCTYKWPAPAPATDQSRPEFRESVQRLQASMFDINGGADGLESCPLTHHFAPGVYMREMLIPAGTTIVGKLHRHAHHNLVLRGLAVVATEFGDKVVKGGDVFVSQPGTKRAVRAIEDTVWITVHPNVSDTQDLSAIEEYVIAPSYEALGHEQKEKLQ